MKKILFRGKDQTNTWRYGDFRHNDSKAYIEESGILYAVSRETVGQFIGIFDNKVKGVYEGDIVRAMSEGVRRICEIAYSERTCGFFLRHPSGPWYISADQELKETFEVIGNIHDNPNLLKRR